MTTLLDSGEPIGEGGTVITERPRATPAIDLLEGRRLLRPLQGDGPGRCRDEGFSLTPVGVALGAEVRGLDLAQPLDFEVRYRWAEGTVAFWDNRATQHYAVGDYGSHTRVAERVAILGGKPY